MWMNGISIMAGAVLATSGLVVANEGLGGELLAYIVAALGGFSVVAGILGTHGARGENTWTLLLYFLLMCAIICGIGAAGIYLLYVFDAACFVYACRRLIDLSLIAGTTQSPITSAQTGGLWKRRSTR